MFDAVRNWFANRHKVPPDKMAEFQAEGILATEDWIKAKLVYLHYKAPGKRFGYKKVWFRSNVVVTEHRLFATVYLNLGIDVQFSDERIHQMTFSNEDGVLLISFDASLFQPNWSGTLEYRFFSANTATLLDTLTNKAVRHG